MNKFPEKIEKVLRAKGFSEKDVSIQNTRFENPKSLRFPTQSFTGQILSPFHMYSGSDQLENLLIC